MRDIMPKMTKSEAKRLVLAIESKAKKLYLRSHPASSASYLNVVTTQDLAAIEKMCAKWMKRIG